MAQFNVGDRVSFYSALELRTVTGVIEQVTPSDKVRVVIDGGNRALWVYFADLKLIGVGGGSHPGPVPERPGVEPVPGFFWPTLLWIAAMIATAFEMLWRAITWPFRKRGQ